MTNYNFSRPIAAYSMSDFENLNNANFKRGKDKKKRKSRTGMIAAGIAGAGAVGGAGVRYGRQAMDFRGQGKAKSQASQMRIDKAIAGGGAKGQLDRDIESVKKAPGKLFNSLKEAPGKAKASGERALKAATTKTGAGNTSKGMLREPISRLGNVFKSGKVGKAAVIGAGLGGAAAVGGAGYAAYKAMKKRKNRD